ncbi:MAG: hypothetical protein AAF489_03860 [Bacteroidota bacterium]
METVNFNYLILLMRITFLYFVGRELYMTRFKKKRNKWIWFLMVLAFSWWGYSIYLAFRRRLVVKRKFAPKFATDLGRK